MTYTYNQETKCFGIYTNFKPETLPEGYVEITEEEYNRLQEEQNSSEEQEENK